MSYVEFDKFDNNLGIEYSKYASNQLHKDYWVVKKSFRFILDENTYVQVPQGFLTDGASVPRFLWSIIPPWGSYGEACALHDYLCEHLTIYENDEKKLINRKYANEIFKMAMENLGVPKKTISIIFGGVELYRWFINQNKPTSTFHKLEIEKYLVEVFNQTDKWL